MVQGLVTDQALKRYVQRNHPKIRSNLFISSALILTRPDIFSNILFQRPKDQMSLTDPWKKPAFLGRKSTFEPVFLTT
jgi:hypothetical protein